MWVLEAILSPVIWVMGLLFHLFLTGVGSVGIAILLLSVTCSLLLLPFQRAGARLEGRVNEKARQAQEEISAERKKGLRGEALFNATEAIYQKYNYHPIHAVFAASGFLASIPVLISGIILFNNEPALTGAPFLFINDLSQPDALIGPQMNILPLLMTAVTWADAWLRYRNDKAAKLRFAVISIVLLVLVYPLPSGLVLFWLGSNLTSFVLARMVRAAQSQGASIL